MEWCSGTTTQRMNICMMLKQHLHCHELSVYGCEMQRSQQLVILCSYIRAVFQQKPHNFQLLLIDKWVGIDCLMEWCPAIFVPGVDIHTLLDNHPSAFNEGVSYCHVQWSLTIEVPNIHPHAVRKE